jgi:CubicO group peptidase (beta-lactamase class C family)
MKQAARRLLAAALSMALTTGVLCTSGVALAARKEPTPLPVAKPETLGMSSERLAYMGEYFKGEVAHNNAAGYVLLVARDGKLVYSAAVGLRDREAGAAMTLDTRFRIASMTKPVTATAVMMLYEEAKLQLDDPVSRYLPEFSDLRVFAGLDEAGNPKTEPVKRPLTIRHLLTHTGGLGYGGFFDGLSPSGNAKAWATLNLQGGETLADKVREVAKLPLYTQPGDAWRYSVSNDVLGRLVEVVSGLSFDRFLQERLFNPLGMTHTGFNVPEQDLDKVAGVYTQTKDGGLERANFGPLQATATLPTFISGGGGLLSTAGDYLRFAQMLANGGTLEGRQYLSPVTVALMTSNQVPDDAQSKYWGDNSLGLGYGLGVAPEIDFRIGQHATLDGDYAWGGVLDTHWIASPRTGLVAVLMCQVNPVGRRNPGRTDADFRGLLYAAVKTLERPDAGLGKGSRGGSRR